MVVPQVIFFSKITLYFDIIKRKIGSCFITWAGHAPRFPGSGQGIPNSSLFITSKPPESEPNKFSKKNSRRSTLLLQYRIAELVIFAEPKNSWLAPTKIIMELT